MGSGSDVGDRLRRSTQEVNPPDGDPFERLQRRRARKHRRERLLAGGISVALVGALIAGSLMVLHGTRTRAGGAASGGAASGGGPSVPVELQPGQYLYMKQTLVLHGDTFTTETWWATDGSGRQRITCSTKDCVTDSGPGYTSAYGTEGDETFGPGRFPTDDDLTGLSTDPDTLRQQLIDRTAPGGRSPEPAFSPGPELGPGVTVGGLLSAIANILQDPNGQPALKAAVFEVAAGVPGVDVRTGTTDPDGRVATSLRFPVEFGATFDYYFDPTTELLMGYAPTGTEYFTEFDQGIVGSTDITPTGDQWVFPPATP